MTEGLFLDSEGSSRSSQRMDFFESIKQGVMGLMLFAGNWLLPQEDDAVLEFVSVKELPAASASRVQLKMELPLNRQAEELIDAGIPLNVRLTAISDKADTVALTRTLRCNVADLTYTVSDSAETVARRESKPYPMILLALRDFGKWEFDLPAGAASCRAEAEILPSRVSRLNRSVDMSRMWGRQKIRATFSLVKGE